MIEKLTKAQEKRKIEVLNEGFKIGACTDPVDEVLAEVAVRKMYVLAGQKEPRRVIFVSSPKVAEEIIKLSTGSEGFTGTWFLGNQDQHWIGFYQFGAEIGVKYKAEDAEKLDVLSMLAKSAGWMYPFEKIALVCDRPKECHFEGGPGTVLHKDGGPSVAYRDGDSLWHLHGQMVPQWLAETPADQLDASKVLGIENVDQRREGIRKIGIARVESKLGAKTIDSDSIPTDSVDDSGEKNGEKEVHEYELREFQLSGVQTKSRALKMLNPSLPGVFHFEGVPPWINTCREARAWRFLGSRERKEFDEKKNSYVEPRILT